ncbi:MAG TPA: DUF748 domain-containing protein [Mariniphaga sp.]|nr:DUF748 domain-containing protein [Mariniphaga sp.]
MRKTWIWVLVIVLILVAIRIALPSIIKKYVNKTLNNLEGYEGSVEDINLALIRGAYVIKDLIIVEDSMEIPVPFVSISRIDLSVQWNALFKGKIVGEVIIEQPVINFAVDEKGTQDGSEVSWQEIVKDMLPIEINRFEIRDGAISYYDFTTDPELEVFLQNFDLVITNLSNVESEDERLPTTIHASGNSLGGGRMNIEAQLNPLMEIPDIDLTLVIEGADMTAFNDFVRAYTNTDIEQGTFNLYSEVVIDKAQLQGYVRPVMENLKILDWDEEEGGFLKKTWEAMVEGVKQIFENPQEDQVATQTPLQGDLSAMNIDAGIWPTIWGLFRNAFVEAISKQTEDAIDFPIQNEGNS